MSAEPEIKGRVYEQDPLSSANMKPNRVFAVALILAAIPTLATSAPAWAQLDASIDFENPESGPGVVMSDEMQDLASRLTSLTEASAESLTGVHVDSSGAVVLSVGANADVSVTQARVNKLADATARSGAPTSVKIKKVGHSKADLDRINSEIKARLSAGELNEVVGLGVDNVQGRAVIYIKEDSKAARRALRKDYGGAVVFRKAQPAQLREEDRARDSRDHYAGSGIRLWDPRNDSYLGGWCSTSFSFTNGSATYMLTAGHCFPGSTGYPWAWAYAFTTLPDIKYSFGKMITTTVGGTPDNTTTGSQPSKGDWAVLGTSTYGRRVYNCTPRPGQIGQPGICSSLAVGAADYGDPVQGAGVCTSGYSTGQLCRHVVVDPAVSNAVDRQGATIGQLALIVPQDGSCNTTRPGDSGGAVYAGISSRPGYVRAMGIVMGGFDDCDTLYTKLKGVRVHYPNGYVPTL